MHTRTLGRVPISIHGSCFGSRKHLHGTLSRLHQNSISQIRHKSTTPSPPAEPSPNSSKSENGALSNNPPGAFSSSLNNTTIPQERKRPQNLKMDEISSLLDSVFKDTAAHPGASSPMGSRSNPSSGPNSGSGSGSGSSVGKEFRSLFERPDIWSVTRSVRDSVTRDSKGKGPSRQNYPELKLNPSLGRTVPVDPAKGIEFSNAMAMMESTLARNNVRKDEIAQRFHVRKGMKRKLLKASRWRRLFKSSFQATVSRCMELKRQGW